MNIRRSILVLVAGALLLHGMAQAIGRSPERNQDTALDPATVRIEEGRYLGSLLPRETRFVDASGRPFALAEVLGKPVVLVLSYYGCDGSCPTINQNLAHELARVSRFQSGRDYRVMTVSFDHHDTSATANQFVQKLRELQPQVADGWRFAVLQDASPEKARAFASLVGFNFFWSRLDKTFVHPNVLVFLTPEGRVARYIYGTGTNSRNIELALIDADWARISTSTEAVFDMVTGACFSFNYADGKYQPNYALFAGIGSLLFGLGLMGGGAWAYRRKMARRTAHAL